MIDEKILIEDLKKWQESLIERDVLNDVINDVLDTVTDIAMNNIPKVGEWISVSERLLDVDIEVLVSCKARITKYSYIDIDYRSKKNGKWAYFGEGEDVIAWQPLPEPYREESVK